MGTDHAVVGSRAKYLMQDCGPDIQFGLLGSRLHMGMEGFGTASMQTEKQPCLEPLRCDTHCTTRRPQASHPLCGESLSEVHVSMFHRVRQCDLLREAGTRSWTKVDQVGVYEISLVFEVDDCVGPLLWPRLHHTAAPLTECLYLG